jgi:CRP/FNR family cyclic AMP-dependent transcriptional regulator
MAAISFAWAAISFAPAGPIAIGSEPARARRWKPQREGVERMVKGDVAAMLARVPLFSGCSKRELALIANAAKEVGHKAGTVIAREGEHGIGLFLILEGQCRVTIGGKQKAILGPGDFFGEIALIDGGPRTATVTAISDVRLLGITEWVFRGLLREHPSIAIHTLEAIAGRLRAVSKEPV